MSNIISNWYKDLYLVRTSTFRQSRFHSVSKMLKCQNIKIDCIRKEKLINFDGKWRLKKTESIYLPPDRHASRQHHRRQHRLRQPEMFQSAAIASICCLMDWIHRQTDHAQSNFHPATSQLHPRQQSRIQTALSAHRLQPSNEPTSTHLQTKFIDSFQLFLDS